MTKQETFDRVAAHLLTQNRQAQAVYGDPKWAPYVELACAYRGDGGTMCAVGCLIPDDRYRPELEGGIVVPLLGVAGTPLYEPSDKDMVITRLVEELGHNLYLCAALQNVHDNYPPEEWRHRLAVVAHAENLDPTVLR